MTSSAPNRPPERAPSISESAKRGGSSSEIPPPRARPDSEPPPPTPAFRPLPHPLTECIGREREVDEIHARLRSHRLVTLTGTGGVGKTRLALHAARSLSDDFPEGVAFVELAPLSHPSLIAQTIAAALELDAPPELPPEVPLLEGLANRSILLILDNCEHLIDACARFTEMLLASLPRLRILATSRERLRIPGEAVYTVPPLSLPEGGGCRSPAELERFESVRLFLDRAQAAVPDFALTPQDLTAVADLCRRLEGIPLAIELAAAQLTALTMDQIAARLGEPLGVLCGGNRNAPPRQQDLRGVMDWSYGLLSEGERALFRRLSVFAGGWTLEAAEKVCAGEGMPEAKIRGLLKGLVEKSLVLAGSLHPGGRYGFLETVRQYAHEKLAEVGESEAVHDRHFEYYQASVAPFEERTRMTSEERNRHDERLEADLENLRASLRWRLIEKKDARPGVELVIRLRPFWDDRGYIREAREWFKLALSFADLPSDLQPLVYSAAADYALRLGDYDTACHYGGLKLQWDREWGDLRQLSYALVGYGRALLIMGRFEGAGKAFEEALEIKKALGDRLETANVLAWLGNAARHREDFEAACAHYTESLTLAREAGHEVRAAWTLGHLGEMAYETGEYAEARRCFEEMLPVIERQGDRFTLMNVHRQLGHVARYEGDVRTARSEYTYALEEGMRERHRERLISSLEEFAALAVVENALERAAILFGAAEQLRPTVGMRVGHPRFLRDLKEARDAAEAALGRAAFTRAWEVGGRMSLYEAATYALSEGEADGG